jgi:hypothetical protein
MEFSVSTSRESWKFYPGEREIRADQTLRKPWSLGITRFLAA